MFTPLLGESRQGLSRREKSKQQLWELYIPHPLLKLGTVNRAATKISGQACLLAPSSEAIRKPGVCQRRLAGGMMSLFASQRQAQDVPNASRSSAPGTSAFRFSGN